jgi:hypothetical protein
MYVAPYKQPESKTFLKELQRKINEVLIDEFEMEVMVLEEMKDVNQY